jgi:hypothetical protein
MGKVRASPDALIEKDDEWIYVEVRMGARDRSTDLDALFQGAKGGPPGPLWVLCDLLSSGLEFLVGYRGGADGLDDVWISHRVILERPQPGRVVGNRYREPARATGQRWRTRRRCLCARVP